MHRLSGEKELKSTTYTRYILPILNKNMRAMLNEQTFNELVAIITASPEEIGRAHV